MSNVAAARAANAARSKLPPNTHAFHETKRTRLLEVVGKRTRNETVAGALVGSELFVHVGSSKPGPRDFFWAFDGKVRRAEGFRTTDDEIAESLDLDSLFDDERADTSCASVALTRDGQLVVAAGHPSVLLIDPTKQLVIRRFDGHDRGDFGWLQISLSPSDDLVVRDNAGDALHFWSLATSECIRTIRAPHGHAMALPVFSADGAQMLMRSATRGEVGEDTLSVWDAKTGKAQRELFVAKEGVYLQAIAFLPSMRAIAVATTESIVRLFDATTFEPVDVIDMRAARDPIVQLLPLPPDGVWGPRFAAFGSNGVFYVFESKS